MKFKWKSLLKIGVGIFILFLAIYYWKGVSGFIATVITGARSLFIGAVIAYIVNILMCFYERYYFPKRKDKKFIKITRTPVCMVSAVLTLLCIIALVTGVVIPQFVDCIKTLVNTIPSAMEKLEDNVLFSKLLPEYVASTIENMNWQSTVEKAIDIAKDSIGGVVGSITTVVSSVFSGIISAFVSIIFAFYILLSKSLVFP